VIDGSDLAISPVIRTHSSHHDDTSDRPVPTLELVLIATAQILEGAKYSEAVQLSCVLPVKNFAPKPDP
jgi:hypothetical protein